MPTLLKKRKLHLIILIIIFFMGLVSFGCGSSGSSGGGGGCDSTLPSGLVVFSDVHFDPFYDTSLFDSLAAASAVGKKVWLLMHIPPGANIFSTKNHIDDSGHITSASMMWETEYQESFLETLAAYPNVVVWMLAGHTHMDEYRLPSGALEITPAISPVFSNDPAFKVFAFSSGSYDPTDYTSVYYNLAAMCNNLGSYYTFSTSYSLGGLLDDLLAELYPTLATNTTRQNLYRGYYYSGHDSASPITDTNWPVYWCGIGEMTEQDVIDCVNGY